MVPAKVSVLYILNIVLTWKIVVPAKVSVFFIYIYIYIDEFFMVRTTSIFSYI